MKTDYTPGPWVAYVEIDGSFEIKAPGAGTTGWDLEICTRQGSFSRREELDSNARLIASAPALFQELENIANADVSEWDDPGEFRAWAQSRARHALNKITGETT